MNLFRAVAIATACLVSPLSAQTPTPLTAERVAAYADGMMRTAMESNGVAGATIAVVQDGKVLLAKGYGTARIAPRPQATTANTLFQIASISKTPVYLAIMQLAERGKLKLDDPANVHLPPALRIPDQGFTKPVLIRHLMTHSAGFEDSAVGHLFMAKPETLMPIASYAARYRPDRVNPPGLQASYSNYALVLLGAIIEQKSGLDFPTYMERNILRPLGMARATYREPYSPALGKRLRLPAPMDSAVAGDITQQLKGGPLKWTEASPEWTTQVAPAGGLRASANDMAAYALALTDPARLEAADVLRTASFAEMLKPGIALPGAVRHGFMNYWLPGGRWGFGHGGAMAYGASDLIIVPDLKLGVFVSTNGRGGFAFANDVVRRMLADFAPLPPLPVVRDAKTKAQAAALAGDWILNRRAWSRTEAAVQFFVSGLSVAATKEGDLMIGDITGDAQRFQPIGNGVWQSERRATRRIAAADAAGTMTIWSGSGTGGMVRAAPLDRPKPVAAVIVLTLIVGTVAAVRGGVRLFRRPAGWTPRERFAAGSLSVAGLLWALGLGGFLTTLLMALPDDGASLLFSWPGPLVVIAWTVAAACAGSIVALVGLRAFSRGATWSWWRKARHVAALVLFSATAIACWHIDLVGYSSL